MSGKTDEALLSGVQAGDEGSLRELFLRHYAPLCRFAHGFTRQREVAEEAVSRVFEDLWRRRAVVRIGTSVKAWLYGAARLQALDRMRALARQRTVSLEELATEPEHDESGRGFVLQEELHEEIERLLRSLPAQRQLVFRLNRFEGLRYREIAEALGLSEQTVQNHMVLAVRQLAPARPRLEEALRR